MEFEGRAARDNRVHVFQLCVFVVSERLLRDRRLFYGVLSRHKIPVPNHVVVSRDGLVESHTKLEEFDDHIIVEGKRLNKPFVEKPVDAEVRHIAAVLVLVLPTCVATTDVGGLSRGA